MILEELERGGTRYSVRAHGASVRLYTNGVFHSQWSPSRPFAGGVWDCLSLPALYREPDAVRRALVLGVGGGAVLRQLALLSPAVHVTGVEIEPAHLDIARRHFGLGALEGTGGKGAADAAGKGGGAGTARAGGGAAATLVCADAVRWMAHAGASAGPFDLIVDDLYGHADGEPVRAVALEPGWIGALVERLAPDGLYVANTVDAREASRAVPALADAGLRHGARWSQDAWENVVLVASRAPLHSRDWSRRLDAAGLDAESRRRARATPRRPIRWP